MRKEKQVIADDNRKKGETYQARRKSAWYHSESSNHDQHHYGPNTKQPDPSKEDLMALNEKLW